eukprot:IDg12904t1
MLGDSAHSALPLMVLTSCWSCLKLAWAAGRILYTGAFLLTASAYFVDSGAGLMGLVDMGVMLLCCLAVGALDAVCLAIIGRLVNSNLTLVYSLLMCTLSALRPLLMSGVLLGALPSLHLVVGFLASFDKAVCCDSSLAGILAVHLPDTALISSCCISNSGPLLRYLLVCCFTVPLLFCTRCWCIRSSLLLPPVLFLIRSSCEDFVFFRSVFCLGVIFFGGYLLLAIERR